MRKLKKYRVKLRVAYESWNGFDHEDEKIFEVEAMNQKTAYKKAEALLKKNHPRYWLRNGLSADLIV